MWHLCIRDGDEDGSEALDSCGACMHAGDSAEDAQSVMQQSEHAGPAQGPNSCLSVGLLCSLQVTVCSCLQLQHRAKALALEEGGGVGVRLMALKFLEQLIVACTRNSWPADVLVPPAQARSYLQLRAGYMFAPAYGATACMPAGKAAVAPMTRAVCNSGVLQLPAV